LCEFLLAVTYGLPPQDFSHTSSQLTLLKAPDREAVLIRFGWQRFSHHHRDTRVAATIVSGRLAPKMLTTAILPKKELGSTLATDGTRAAVQKKRRHNQTDTAIDCVPAVHILHGLPYDVKG